MMMTQVLLLNCRKITGAKCDRNMSREAVAKQLFKGRGNCGMEPTAVNSRTLSAEEFAT